MWLSAALPSMAFRNLAMVEDVRVLSGSDVNLAVLPGWSQFPEAEAMASVARAMGKTVIELNEGIFREPECQEY